MKLSALLLSVNIAASLPIAFCQMAPAAEEGVAETGDWLKNNLASIKKGKADLPTSRLKVSIPERISSGDKSVDAYVARLKPINKATKLPSKHDLDMQLVSMTPRMAVDPNAQLMGNVSQAQYGYPAPSPYRQPQSLANMVPRGLGSADSSSFKHSAMAMARQAIAGAHHMGAAPSAKALKSAKHAAKESLQDRMDDWLGEPKAGEKMIGHAGASLVQMPVMPQQMSLREADLERQMNGMPVGNIQPVQPEQMQPQQSSAGPAPFPLNLVPEAQLKNFIRGGRGDAPAMGGMGHGMGMGPGSMGMGAGAMGGGMSQGMGAGMGAGMSHGMGHGMRQAPPKAYFGSWHGGNSHGLPRAGFQSNIHSKGFGGKANVVQMRPKNRYAKSPKVTAPRLVANNINSSSQRNYTVKAALPPQVATYGAYTSRAF
jgi:hypothetical protein